MTEITILNIRFCINLTPFALIEKTATNGVLDD
jgi:hypothetical protein